MTTSRSAHQRTITALEQQLVHLVQLTAFNTRGGCTPSRVSANLQRLHTELAAIVDAPDTLTVDTIVTIVDRLITHAMCTAAAPTPPGTHPGPMSP